MTGRLQRIAAWVKALSGWRCYALLFAVGVLSAAALPPVFCFPVLFPAFMVLFWRLEASASKRQAFATGWWFGFGHHIAGLYWISISLLVEPDKFAWLIPLAVSAIPAACAVYIGLVTLAVWMLPRRGSGRRVLLLACVWVLAEMLRAQLFTGFPWNLLGSVWAFSDSILQTASVVGVYGISFLAVLAATLPVLFVENRVRPVLAVFIAIACIGAGGAWRISAATETIVPGIQLRVVQGNIPQSDKWDYNVRMANLQHYMELSRGEGFKTATHVIWPESAVPYVLNERALVLSRLRMAVPPHGLLLTGAVRQPEAEPAQGSYPQLWNSLFAIDSKGQVQAVYDKVHLVPFGEFIPFNKVLPLQKITHGMLDFTPGVGPVTISLPPLPPFSPLICYEAIFSGEVAGPRERPLWLLNVTNDAWFGVSSGPYQHLESARMRAIEEGIPLVRAANTGISAVIDAYGRIVQALPLNHEGVIDAALPESTAHSTIYSMLARLLPLMIIILMITTVLVKK